MKQDQNTYPFSTSYITIIKNDDCRSELEKQQEENSFDYNKKGNEANGDVSRNDHKENINNNNNLNCVTKINTVLQKSLLFGSRLNCIRNEKFTYTKQEMMICRRKGNENDNATKNTIGKDELDLTLRNYKVLESYGKNNILSTDIDINYINNTLSQYHSKNNNKLSIKNHNIHCQEKNSCYNYRNDLKVKGTCQLKKHKIISFSRKSKFSELG